MVGRASLDLATLGLKVNVDLSRRFSGLVDLPSDLHLHSEYDSSLSGISLWL